MSNTEYVPHESYVRHRYISGEADVHDTPEWEAGADFDRFLVRVRQDAVQQFIEACRGKMVEPGFLLPSNRWRDIEAAIRVAESYVKNYPEEIQ